MQKQQQLIQHSMRVAGEQNFYKNGHYFRIEFQQFSDLKKPRKKSKNARIFPKKRDARPQKNAKFLAMRDAIHPRYVTE